MNIKLSNIGRKYVQHIFTNDPEQRNTPQDMRPITMLDYTIKSLKNLQMHSCKKGTMQLGDLVQGAHVICMIVNT
jgi:hypothetical protein